MTAGTIVEPGPGTRVWRVGYRPEPWAWTGYEWSDNNKFSGRWDDPHGSYFRTMYAGSTLQACLLEVLAAFRSDANVVSGMGDIKEDEEDAAAYPTAPAGEVPRTWLEPRIVTSAELTGKYYAITESQSLSALYPHFIGRALSLGLQDFDAAALKDLRARDLTQAVAFWLYKRADLDGIRYKSRHGDDLDLWAIFEQKWDPQVSLRLQNIRSEELHHDAIALRDAFRMLHLAWQSEDIGLSAPTAPAIEYRPEPQPSWDGYAYELPRASISVVIPTLNQERNLPWILRRMPSYVDQVVIVDDRSKDSTVEVARALRPDVVVVDEASGSTSAALIAGFTAATGEIIVTLDAEGSMDPQEILYFIPPLRANYDLVKGSRRLTGGGSEDITKMASVGVRMLTRLANVLLHSNYSDLTYGYIAFRRECLEVLGLEPEAPDLQVQIMARAAKAGLRIAEVPSIELDKISTVSGRQLIRRGWSALRSLLHESLFWQSPTAGARPEVLR